MYRSRKAFDMQGYDFHNTRDDDGPIIVHTHTVTHGGEKLTLMNE